MAWFKTPAQEQLLASNGWDGSVRQDPGDYMYAVDANVAPASNGNLVTQRSQSLAVQIDPVGDAHDTLQLSWNNGVLGPLVALAIDVARTIGMAGSEGRSASWEEPSAMVSHHSAMRRAIRRRAAPAGRGPARWWRERVQPSVSRGAACVVT